MPGMFADIDWYFLHLSIPAICNWKVAHYIIVLGSLHDDVDEEARPVSCSSSL